MWDKIIIMTPNVVLTPVFPVKTLRIGQLIFISTINNILFTLRVLVLFVIQKVN